MVLHDASLAAPLRLIWAGLDLHPAPLCATTLLCRERRLSGSAPDCILHHIQGRWWVPHKYSRAALLIRT